MASAKWHHLRRLMAEASWTIGRGAEWPSYQARRRSARSSRQQYLGLAKLGHPPSVRHGDRGRGGGPPSSQAQAGLVRGLGDLHLEAAWR